MIEIIDKKNCCGCWACVQQCPKQCISMIEDDEGFLYPKVDKGICINCHLCEYVCPIINTDAPRKPLETYAAINKDEQIRLESSSGGIFSAIAEYIINDGGVVFGAKFNDKWEVIHDYTETIDGLAQFRGSKYVQSQIGDNYKKAKQFLTSGRKVLFSGTPCQIAGLKHFLKKEYENLLTVDFICHGVPSPGVWREYLKEEVATCNLKNIVLPRSIHGRDALNVTIEGISFRDKTLGWKKFSFALDLSTSVGRGEKIQFRTREHLHENLFLKGFLANLFLRPSCYNCVEKNQRSGSDITLSDFWGCDKTLPQMYDDKGTSGIFINTQQGISIIANINVTKIRINEGNIIEMNRCYFKSTRKPDNRNKFITSYRQNGILFSIKKFAHKSIRENLRINAIKLLSKIGILNFIKNICKIQNV